MCNTLNTDGGSVFHVEERFPMYFCGFLRIKYSMRKIHMALCALAVASLAAGGFAAFSRNAGVAEPSAPGVITVWQIDSFEGGKGSRAQYLRSVGDELLESSGVYTEVVALSSAAARENIAAGNLPDIISYGAGFCGAEGVTDGNARAWCRGGYCLITTGENFEDVTYENTVVNAGRDNLVGVAALFAGLERADVLPPTSAYVALLSGDYEYLLGTQRDVIRLQTRGVDFSVCPLTDYNDLYQYITVLARGQRRAACERFVELLDERDDTDRIGMLRDGLMLYSDEMHVLEGAAAVYTLPPMAGGDYIGQVKSAVRSKDINLLKSLLKPL